MQGGDVNGDGQLELVVLGSGWDLYLLAGDVSQIWHNEALPVGNTAGAPAPGQLIVNDLDGDGQAEIVVLAPAPALTVHVLDGDGRRVWQHALESVSTDIPSVHSRTHEAVSTRSPTSTTHIRQTPTGCMRCEWQSTGISMPICRAASQIVVPG